MRKTITKYSSKQIHQLFSYCSPNPCKYTTVHPFCLYSAVYVTYAGYDLR